MTRAGRTRTRACARELNRAQARVIAMRRHWRAPAGRCRGRDRRCAHVSHAIVHLRWVRLRGVRSGRPLPARRNLTAESLQPWFPPPRVVAEREVGRAAHDMFAAPTAILTRGADSFSGCRPNQCMFRAKLLLMARSALCARLTVDFRVAAEHRPATGDPLPRLTPFLERLPLGQSAETKTTMAASVSKLPRSASSQRYPRTLAQPHWGP